MNFFRLLLFWGVVVLGTSALPSSRNDDDLVQHEIDKRLNTTIRLGEEILAQVETLNGLTNVDGNVLQEINEYFEQIKDSFVFLMRLLAQPEVIEDTSIQLDVIKEHYDEMYQLTQEILALVDSEQTRLWNRCKTIYEDAFAAMVISKRTFTNLAVLNKLQMEHVKTLVDFFSTMQAEISKDPTDRFAPLPIYDKSVEPLKNMAREAYDFLAPELFQELTAIIKKLAGRPDVTPAKEEEYNTYVDKLSDARVEMESDLAKPGIVNDTFKQLDIMRNYVVVIENLAGDLYHSEIHELLSQYRKIFKDVFAKIDKAKKNTTDASRLAKLEEFEEKFNETEKKMKHDTFDGTLEEVVVIDILQKYIETYQNMEKEVDTFLA